MAVKNLKPDGTQSSGTSDSNGTITSPKRSSSSSSPINRISKVFNKVVSIELRSNSSKEERSPSRQEEERTVTPIQRKLSSELQRVFCYFDENGDGKISAAELQSCMRATGEDLSPEEAEAAVRLSDSDGDGELGFEDFARLVEAEDERERDRNLMDAFRMYEMDDRGCITPKSLRRMLRKLGEDRTVEDCTGMIKQFDLNGDGVLSFEEFKIMMQ